MPFALCRHNTVFTVWVLGAVGFLPYAPLGSFSFAPTCSYPIDLGR